MIPLVRLSCDDRTAELAYVSFDSGKSWWVLYPDGTTRLQFRTPPVPQVFNACRCTEE